MAETPSSPSRRGRPVAKSGRAAVSPVVNGLQTAGDVRWTRDTAREISASEQVVHHVRRLVERGELGVGDRLPAERALAQETGVSRSSVRVGLRALSAMGVVQSRHGAGTFITDAPALESEPLQFLAALHGVSRDAMFEARRLLEVGVAGLCAERATGDSLAGIADEVTSMFASMEDPRAFLVHDIRFHRSVAASCGNPILAAVVEMVSGIFYETRRANVHRATDLREAAEMHRRIYHAIRSHDATAARTAMNEHLLRSERAQVMEEATLGDSPQHEN
jgi:GntR family transcriptional regulator, transcriptional repressor for pyruvate dehydrogenase complex